VFGVFLACCCLVVMVLFMVARLLQCTFIFILFLYVVARVFWLVSRILRLIACC